MSIKTQTQVIQMKKGIIEQCLAKKMQWKDAAKILSIHPKSLSRLKKNYLEYGETVLIGKKPGPKKGRPDNKTPDYIEELVENLAIKNVGFGPKPIADLLLDEYGIKMHSTTVWRILTRREVRYTIEYKRWKKEPKYYCLETPGQEVQLDASFPFGRGRKIVTFDAIDDCSRWVFAKVYEGTECDDLAIQYISELIKKAPFLIRKFRVDNHFGRKFKEYCGLIGIEVIYNDAYSPEQNEKIERYHKTAKHEFFWKYCAFNSSAEEMNYQYSLYLRYYNYQGRHSGFGMAGLTPAQKITFSLLNSLNFIKLQKVT